MKAIATIDDVELLRDLMNAFPLWSLVTRTINPNLDTTAFMPINKDWFSNKSIRVYRHDDLLHVSNSVFVIDTIWLGDPDYLDKTILAVKKLIYPWL